MRGIHWSPVNSPHKGQWCGALMFSFICTWVNNWVIDLEAGEPSCSLWCYYNDANLFLKYIVLNDKWYPDQDAMMAMSQISSCPDMYSISKEICTRFCCALLCCGYAIVHNEFTWSIYPYFLGYTIPIHGLIGPIQLQLKHNPDNKIHGANMGPIWGRQDPGGPHVGLMNFAIWVKESLHDF